ncbi:glycosyltransferase [Gordonia ajococcus]|uniref:glycosyltransferase n=1 Tax=Gordonia ajococcus TaxID=1292359 RepID=UPI00178296F9|nr:glycosyltransferase [Gordonia ajococcus]
MVIPDPWTGPFGQEGGDTARLSLGLSDAPIVGLVGMQNHRKGFDVAADSIAQLALKDGEFQVVIVGDVDPSLACKLGELESRLGSRLTHITDYVSDSVLAQLMASFSVTLLPYSAAFTSTSGVLSRSVASGTPVIASDHGLIAHRVETWGLGMTFRYPDSNALQVCLEAAFRGEIRLSSRAQSFVSGCTATALEARVVELLSD